MLDIHQATLDYLLAFPLFASWQEAGMILQRAASTHPRDWELPLLSCQTVGASPEKAIPASAALACAQISIILVDDMLDEDPRGEYQRIGHGRASNLASAFGAVGMEALRASKARSPVRLEALNSLSRMIQTTAHGQEMDIQNPVDETSYWRVVKNKSAPFYGCALYLGALLGGAASHTAHSLQYLGWLYGEMIQIHDDLNDSMAVPANPDWVQRRKPLPILFALSVNHPHRARFADLYHNISDQGALPAAQEILIRSGAVSYCVDQLLRRHQAAQEVLAKALLPDRGIMDSLIDAVTAPVWKLFKTLGISLEVPPITAAVLNQE